MAVTTPTVSSAATAENVLARRRPWNAAVASQVRIESPPNETVFRNFTNVFICFIPQQRSYSRTTVLPVSLLSDREHAQSSFEYCLRIPNTLPPKDLNECWSLAASEFAWRTVEADRRITLRSRCPRAKRAFITRYRCRVKQFVSFPTS